jgi:hypothetical protein
MAGLTSRLASSIICLLLTASAAEAQGAPPAPPSRQPSAATQEPDCARMLLDAASALRNEQYPSMAQIAVERQRACPGPDSLFLLGIAKANMIHNGLVARESESLVRAQAIRALSSALDSEGLRGEWLQPANAWHRYLQRQELELDAHEAPSSTTATPQPVIIPAAAPPWEPEPSNLGPMLLASAGIGFNGAGTVTAIIASNRSPHDGSSTLDTVTTGLFLGSGIALVAALTCHLLTPHPDDTVQLSFAADPAHRGSTAKLQIRF